MEGKRGGGRKFNLRPRKKGGGGGSVSLYEGEQRHTRMEEGLRWLAGGGKTSRPVKIEVVNAAPGGRSTGRRY